MSDLELVKKLKEENQQLQNELTGRDTLIEDLNYEIEVLRDYVLQHGLEAFWEEE